jgi:hypothetical protein
MIKMAWYWHKKQTWRPVEQNRGQDIKPHKYNQLVFDKGAKNI